MRCGSARSASQPVVKTASAAKAVTATTGQAGNIVRRCRYEPYGKQISPKEQEALDAEIGEVTERLGNPS